MIGYYVNAPDPAANYRLNIGNTIYGDLGNGRVGIGTSTLTYALNVAGGDVNTTSGGYRDAGSCVAGTCASDARLKKDIRYLSRSLDTITALRPARFSWRKKVLADHGLPPHSGTGAGLIAQDVEQVLPHLVKTGKKGFKKVVYGLELQMHMIQAIKELKANNNTLKSENETLKSTLDSKTAALKTALDSRTAALNARYDRLEKKLALLERDSNPRHASQGGTAHPDSHPAAGALNAGPGSSGGVGGDGGGAAAAGPARALPRWTSLALVPALTAALALALLAGALRYRRKSTAPQGA